MNTTQKYPTKAYILRIEQPISYEYAKTCAESCDKVGLTWEYFNGFADIPKSEALARSGINVRIQKTPPKIVYNTNDKALCCSISHYAIWKKIAESDDNAAIILEHDAIMLHPFSLNLPDDTIVVLGYKLTNPACYDHLNAGPPRDLLPVAGHEGAHAYAITKNTARMLIDEIEKRGAILGLIDNTYFLTKQRKTRAKIMIASPTPAMGWVRKSTIWGESSVKNADFIGSFKEHLNLVNNVHAKALAVFFFLL
jgi:hypothetical protein